jgi:hypothetical protein
LRSACCVVASFTRIRDAVARPRSRSALTIAVCRTVKGADHRPLGIDTVEKVGLTAPLSSL